TWGLAREQVYAPLGMVGRCVLRHNGLADNLKGARVLPARVGLRYGLFATELDIGLVAEVEAVVSDGTGALLASWLVRPGDLDVATARRTPEGPEILLVLTGELREERMARIERG